VRKYARRSASRIALHHGVSTNPGDTALIRIGASSTASSRTTASKAALIAAMPAVPGIAAWAVIAPSITPTVRPDW
jgi:hypothetical protein